MSETTEAAAPVAGTAEADARSRAAAAIVDDDARERAAAEQLQAERQPPEDAQPEAETPEAATPEGEAPEQPAEDEEVELSFGAKTLKVRKSAIPAEVLSELETFTRSVQADYTRKTQEVAEQRKEAQARLELADKVVSLKGEALKAFARGQALADEIRQLESVDLNALWQSNPDQARRTSDTLAAKRAEFDRVVATVAQHEAAATAEQERFIAAQMEAGRAEMRRAVKGFDEARERELVEYAVKTYGIPEEDARRWPLNPKTALMAWKAMQYDRLQQRAQQASQPKPPPAPPPVKPIRAMSDTGRTRDLAWLAEHDIDAYARERARQEAAARKR